jgi:hypothetical protein
MSERHQLYQLRHNCKEEDKRREVDQALTSAATNPLEEAESAADWTTY